MSDQKRPEDSSPYLKESTTSTTTLVNPSRSAPAPPAKDYAAAFSKLQSRYGTAGSPVLVAKSKPTDTKNSSRSASSTPQSSSSSLPITATSSRQSSEGSASASSSSTVASSDGRSRKKFSLLRTIFKGKAKETGDETNSDDIPGPSG